ncbi:hypothetical protein SRABI118_04228 [Massilia sp. Bi118]|uniref:hypothetical protein n=1 Tax=Massilia sp. Bi118 TaxID=2822346 RepID=UPI001D28C50E|nr:hypothetical protein [Massilia sp. Bi118]CAH0296036.1 hypothetical protein SRABI118_04228 [Massilia sp. Bi118]
MGCANDDFFLDADALAKTRERARSGIQMPDQVKIERNAILYRIGHSNKDIETNLSSPWWMSDASFDYLRRQAGREADRQQVGGVFQELFRNKLAVPHSFGLADMLVKVAVRQRLRAFSGRGGYIGDTQEGGEVVGWIGGFELAQYFIPGLRLDKGGASPMAKSALEVLAYQPLQSFIQSRHGH